MGTVVTMKSNAVPHTRTLEEAEQRLVNAMAEHHAALYEMLRLQCLKRHPDADSYSPDEMEFVIQLGMTSHLLKMRDLFRGLRPPQ